MRRGYTSAQFLATVERARARLDRPAVTTDLIVGFPGETAAAFARTLDVCRRAGFSRTHVFRYSPREGTVAAGLLGRVGAEESKRRAAEAAALGRELAAAFAANCVGREEEVLLETRRGGYTGRYVRTEVAGAGLRPGELHAVQIVGAGRAGLRAEAR
jgi:threonylcarbamoyladenosine tRNA methylthiotransferase MtaB